MHLRCFGAWVCALIAVLPASTGFAASTVVADEAMAGPQAPAATGAGSMLAQQSPASEAGSTPRTAASPLRRRPSRTPTAAKPADTAPSVPAHARGWIIDGDLSGEYRSATTGRTNEIYLNEGEIDVGHPLLLRNTYQGNLFAQLIDENVADRSGGKGSSSDVSLGEAYVNYHLPIQTETGSTAYIEVGQFVLPVGLLPVYDTHLQELQTLAPAAIGERNDFGVEVQGRFDGVIDYRFSATAGTGSDHVDLNITRVVAFRLGRLFATPYGVFDVGGSLLSGRLPITEVDPITGFPPILSPSGRLYPVYGFVNKTRIVGDGTWTLRKVTLRGEAMTGSDAATSVYGYFLMGEYRFAPGLSAVVARSYWNYDRDNSSAADDALGLNIAYTSHLAVRLLYEEQRDVPYSAATGAVGTPPTHIRHVFTVQALLRF